MRDVAWAFAPMPCLNMAPSIRHSRLIWGPQLTDYLGVTIDPAVFYPEGISYYSPGLRAAFRALPWVTGH